MKKNVTVIIPIYKDWATLEKCLSSLKKYLNKKHSVILINDNSSEADDLEIKIKNAIKTFDNFKYFRNKKNLGFVKTCNRGVFEIDKTENDILLLNSDTEVTEGFLDEMTSVLYLSEKHGVVCPRSNNATILSVPFRYDGERMDIINESLGFHEKLKKLLPQFSIIPTGVGFCMLIRRNLVVNFGLFDKIYGKGYNEENDFCCRINKFGYSIAMANHAFVYHIEGKSFTSAEKKILNEKNELILQGRYPEYLNAVRKYLIDGINPVDYFSEIVCGVYSKKRILFNLYNLPSTHNGTSEYSLSLLNSFVRLFGDKYEITILSNEQGVLFHGLLKKYDRVVYNENIKKIEKRFDIAIMPSQIFKMEQLVLMNRLALRVVFSLLDVIAWRSNYLNNDERDFALNYSLQYADGIISISDFSKYDALAYVGNINTANFSTPIETIHLGIDKERKAIDMRKDDNIEMFKDEDFVLMLGNHFKHKSIPVAIEGIRGLNANVVILGIGKDELERDGINVARNTYCFKSGNLSPDFVEFLYKKCKLLIFPSQYEGFGIPIIKALSYNKKIIVFNNAISRELLEMHPDFKDNFVFFDYFKELRIIIENEIEYHHDLTGSMTSFNSWENVAKETEVFLCNLMEKELDTKKIMERWRFCTYLEHINYEFFRRYGQDVQFHKQNRRIDIEKWKNKVKFAFSSPDKFIKKYYNCLKFYLK